MIANPKCLLTAQKTQDEIEKTLQRALGEMQTEEEYHNHPFISNSNLKTLEQSPRLFHQKKIQGESDDEQSRFMKLGSMIDTMLLEPHQFQSRYVEEPSDLKEPYSSKEKDFCEAYQNGHTAEEAYREVYSTNGKSDEKIREKAQKKLDKFEAYFQFQEEIEEGGRTPYSSDEHQKAMNVFYDIQNHRKAQAFLSPPRHQVQHKEAQMVIPFVQNGVFCRSMLDWVVVGRDRIISIDLKTTSKQLSSFDYWYRRRRYYRQQAMYRRALEYKYRGTDYEDLPVATYVIAAHTKEPHETIVRRIDNALLRQGEQELDTLLDHLKFHIENDVWRRRPKYYQTNDVSVIQHDESEILPLNLQ